MTDNKKILKHFFEGCSQREIAKRMKVSRDRTVSPAISAAMKMDLTWDRIAKLSEDEVTELLFPEKKSIPVYVQPDYEYCHKELMKEGVTLSGLFEEY